MFIVTEGSAKDDCNNIISPGLHNKLIHPEAPNAPGNYYAYLFVLKENPICPYKQIAIGYNTNNIATRIYSSSSQTWTDWEEFVTNSDLPIIESHLLHPNGNDIFTIQLDYPTTDELINVSMSGNNIDYPSIVTAYMTSSNTLAVKLSKAYNRVMRVNVLYYKSK